MTTYQLSTVATVLLCLSCSCLVRSREFAAVDVSTQRWNHGRSLKKTHGYDPYTNLLLESGNCDDSPIVQLLYSVSKSDCWKGKGKDAKKTSEGSHSGTKSSKRNASKSSKGISSDEGENKSKPSSQKESKSSKKANSSSDKGAHKSKSSSETERTQQIPLQQQTPSPFPGPSPLPADETEAPVSRPQTGSQTTSPQMVLPITTSSPALGPQTQQPAASPIVAETIAPILATTSTPTLLPPDGNQRAASPFNLIYNGITGDPTTADFDAATEVILRYLEDFFTSQFALNPFTNLEVFNGTVAGVPDIAGLAVPLEVAVLFSEDSMFIPGRSDLDTLVFVAFQEPWVPDLLTLLAMELPSSNPLSSTMSVTYHRSRR